VRRILRSRAVRNFPDVMPRLYKISMLAALLLLDGPASASASRDRAALAAGAPAGVNAVVLVQPAPGGQRFRVQALSQTMVRVEAEGHEGWEDRPTFLAQNRSWGGAAVVLRNQSATRAAGERYAVEVDAAGEISVFDAAGAPLWRGELGSVTARTKMPQPAERFAVWAVADRPRFAAPRAGPVPGSAAAFDLANQAADVYFFVSNVDAEAPASQLPYATLRREVLLLTGPVPLLPDYAFGTMFTWYHNYTAGAKLAEIAEFAARGTPPPARDRNPLQELFLGPTKYLLL
jgi:hypothetical protein